MGPPEPPEQDLDEQDLQALAKLPGVTPDALAEARARVQAAKPREQDCLVWDENWETFAIFLSLAKQWAHVVIVRTLAVPGGGSVTVSESQRDCLPADRVEAALRLAAIPRRKWPALWSDINAMAAEVLRADADLREQRQEVT